MKRSRKEVTRNPTKVYGYCRVSLELQREGQSLDAQEHRIKSMCAARGWTLVEVKRDVGQSGGKNPFSRPELREILEKIGKNDYLVVCDISRFSRSLFHAVETLRYLQETRSAFLHSIDESLDLGTSIGKAMFGILIVFAEFQRDQIGEKVKSTMQNMSKRGVLRTRAPFGWRFVGKKRPLEKSPRQQRVIQKMIDLHKKGYGGTKIANELNNDEFALNCIHDNRPPNSVLRQAHSVYQAKYYGPFVRRTLKSHGYGNYEVQAKPIRERINSARLENIESTIDHASEIIEDEPSCAAAGKQVAEEAGSIATRLSRRRLNQTEDASEPEVIDLT